MDTTAEFTSPAHREVVVETTRHAYHAAALLIHRMNGNDAGVVIDGVAWGVTVNMLDMAQRARPTVATDGEIYAASVILAEEFGGERSEIWIDREGEGWLTIHP